MKLSKPFKKLIIEYSFIAFAIGVILGAYIVLKAR